MADLEQIPGMLRKMAAESRSVHTLPLTLTSEHAAFLLFRELVSLLPGSWQFNLGNGKGAFETPKRP